MVRISQINNSYIFPGLALGILVVRARRVTDGMIMAAAKALALLSPACKDCDAPLLPPIGDARSGALQIAEAVAKQAFTEGVAGIDSATSMADRIRSSVWEPVYLPYEHIESEG